MKTWLIKTFSFRITLYYIRRVLNEMILTMEVQVLCFVFHFTALLLY